MVWQKINSKTYMRLLDLLRKKRSTAATLSLARPPAAPFSVGDRVRDLWGQTGVVTSVDATADFGLGRLVVLMDDGRERAAALLAPGVNRAEDRAQSKN